jgi:hypothetical protein
VVDLISHNTRITLSPTFYILKQHTKLDPQGNPITFCLGCPLNLFLYIKAAYQTRSSGYPCHLFLFTHVSLPSFPDPCTRRPAAFLHRLLSPCPPPSRAPPPLSVSRLALTSPATSLPFEAEHGRQTSDTPLRSPLLAPPPPCSPLLVSRSSLYRFLCAAHLSSCRPLPATKKANVVPFPGVL